MTLKQYIERKIGMIPCGMEKFVEILELSLKEKKSVVYSIPRNHGKKMLSELATQYYNEVINAQSD